MTEDYFRNAVTQRAMVIDFGESQVLEREVPQTVERCVDVDGSGADLFEKAAQPILIHNAKCNWWSPLGGQ